MRCPVWSIGRPPACSSWAACAEPRYCSVRCPDTPEELMPDKTAMPLHGRPLVTGFHDEPTGSVQYVVADPETKSCAIIDPVLDFDPRSGATATHSADALLAHITREGCTL